MFIVETEILKLAHVVRGAFVNAKTFNIDLLNFGLALEPQALFPYQVAIFRAVELDSLPK